LSQLVYSCQRRGTPGKKNSAEGINKDEQPLVLLGGYATNSINIILTFKEPLDNALTDLPSNYNISDNIGTALNAIVMSPIFNTVQLPIASLWQKNKVYTL
jgi:hypothetical protein